MDALLRGLKAGMPSLLMVVHNPSSSTYRFVRPSFLMMRTTQNVQLHDITATPSLWPVFLVRTYSNALAARTRSSIRIQIFSPACGGNTKGDRLRFIQGITEPIVVTAILASIGLLNSQSPSRPGVRRPAQLPLFSKAQLRFLPHAFSGLATLGCRSPPREAKAPPS